MTRGVSEANRWGHCVRCGRPFERRGWRQRYCLDCRAGVYREFARAQNKLYYHRHPQKVMQAIKRTRAKRADYYREQKRRNQIKMRERVRLLVFNYYSKGTFKCECCGENELDFLTLDHINGHGGKQRIALFGRRDFGGTNFYLWLKRNGFPSGYQVLCMNCNLSKGKHGTCVHKKDVEEESRRILEVGGRESPNNNPTSGDGFTRAFSE
jgi:hypothetical protein